MQNTHRHFLLSCELPGCFHDAFQAVFGVGRQSRVPRSDGGGENAVNFQGNVDLLEQSEEERPLLSLFYGLSVIVGTTNSTDSTTFAAALLMCSGGREGGCFWKSMTISTILLTLSSRCVICAPCFQLWHTVSVGQPNVTLDEASDRGVISKLYQLCGKVVGDAVIAKQLRGEDTTRWNSNIGGEGIQVEQGTCSCSSVLGCGG